MDLAHWSVDASAGAGNRYERPSKPASLRVRIGNDERKVTPPDGPGANQFAGQLDHLSQCVLGNREPIVGGEEGMRDLRIMEAIYRSMRSGETIRL